MKTIVLLLGCLLFASLCFGQYTSSIHKGPTDISGYTTSGTNALFPMTSQDCTKGIAVGFDFWTGCLDGSGQIVTYSYPTRTWTAQTAMGSGMIQLAVGHSYLIFSSATSSYCGSPKKRIRKWSGSAWTNLNGCTTDFGAAYDGTLLVVADTNLWASYNSGTTFTQLTGLGSGWSYANVADATHGVAVKTDGSIWLVNPTAGTSSGNTGGVTYKHPSISRFGVPYVIGTDNALYQYTSGAWQRISGTGLTGVASTSKGGVLVTDVNFHPLHYNVFPPYTSGIFSGQYNSCPDANHPCVGTVNHHLYFNIYYPVSLYTQPFDVTAPSTSFFNLTPIGVPDPTTCDYFFGDASVGDCLAADYGDAVCGATDRSLGGPPNPPNCYIPILPGKQWATNAKVSIYFDSRGWCSGGLPCFTVTAGDGNLKSILQGVTNWSQLTNANITYINEGIYTGALCPSVAQSSIPCNGQKPFIFVTANELPPPGDPTIAFTQMAPDHSYSVQSYPVYMLNTLTQTSFDALKTVGAHEEGHDQSLDDCCPVGAGACGSVTNQCTAPQGGTVMWGGYSSQNPRVPSQCDIENSDIGGALVSQ